MGNYIDKIVNKGTTLPIVAQGLKDNAVDGTTIKVDEDNKLYVPSNVDFLKDKRVCFIGDSITDSTYYPDAFCEATGAIEYNRGRSGSEIAGTDAYSFCSRIQWDRNDGNKYADGRKLCLVGLPRKPHLFIVYGGHNDWGHGMEFGDVDDDNYPTEEITFTANAKQYTLTVPTTFCGGVKFLFNYLKTNYPNVPIIALSYHHAQSTFIPSGTTVFPAWNTYSTFDTSTKTITANTKSNGKTWRDYKDAYETIVKSYNIPIVDLELLPCNPFSTDAFMYYRDGLHFSTLGGKVMGNYVADEVAKIRPTLPKYDGE